MGRCSFALTPFLVLFVCAALGAEPPKSDAFPNRYFSFTLQPEYFDVLANDVLHLSKAQRADVDPLFAAYVEAIKQLDERTYKAVQDAGERERSRLEEERQHRIPGRAFDENDPDFQVHSPTREEIELDRRVYEAMSAGVRESDRLLFKFLEDVESKLIEEQLPVFRRVPKLIRLEGYFNLRRGENAGDFAHPHPDFRVIVMSAMKSGAVLEPWNSNKSNLKDDDAAIQQQLASTLREYEEAMSTAIERWGEQQRMAIAPEWVGKHIFMGDNSTWARQRYRDMGQRWAMLYDVNRSFADRISTTLRTTGHGDAAAQWHRMFLVTYAPRLFRDDVVDTLFDWLRDKARAEADQLLSINELLAHHDVERERIRIEGFETMVARVRTYGQRGYPLDDPHRNDPDDRLKQNQNEAIGGIRARLTDTQKQAFDEYLASCNRPYPGYDVLCVPGQAQN